MSSFIGGSADRLDLKLRKRPGGVPFEVDTEDSLGDEFPCLERYCGYQATKEKHQVLFFPDPVDKSRDFELYIKKHNLWSGSVNTGGRARHTADLINNPFRVAHRCYPVYFKECGLTVSFQSLVRDSLITMDCMRNQLTPNLVKTLVRMEHLNEIFGFSLNMVCTPFFCTMSLRLPPYDDTQISKKLAVYLEMPA